MGFLPNDTKNKLPTLALINRIQKKEGKTDEKISSNILCFSRKSCG